jgi:hypothetical protein
MQLLLTVNITVMCNGCETGVLYTARYCTLVACAIQLVRIAAVFNCCCYAIVLSSSAIAARAAATLHAL